MAALTLADLKLHVVHAIGGTSAAMPPGTTQGAAAAQLINQAGRELFTHPWNWRKWKARRSLAAPVEILNGTWTEATKTLTKTSGFTNYTHSVGDIFKVTDGTGATTGEYTIASRTSNNAIVLASSIGAAADGLTDIDGSIYFPYVTLPSDFGELLSIQYAGLTPSIRMVSYHELLSLRSHSISPAGFMYWASIVQPPQASVTVSAGLPRLELFPNPTTGSADVITVFYLRDWSELAADTDVPNIPLWMETLLITYVRTFAESFDDAGASAEMPIRVLNLSNLLAELEGGPAFQRALQRDGRAQRELGELQNGLIETMAGEDRMGRLDYLDGIHQAATWIT